MTNMGSQKRVLALDLRPRSFGFVVFEGPSNLLDWGVRSFPPEGNVVKFPATSKLLALIDEFKPAAIVSKEWATGKHEKKAAIIATIQKQAKGRRIPIICMSPVAIKKATTGFEDNKFGVASALAQQFDVLVWKLPPKRKCWQSEDYRMSIFDAAAIGVAYFARYGKRLAIAEP
jgi:hypothetical protein